MIGQNESIHGVLFQSSDVLIRSKQCSTLGTGSRPGHQGKLLRQHEELRRRVQGGVHGRREPTD